MQRVVIVGAGFGGLELATMLSDAVGGDIDVVLIDKNDSFVFGYSKLDVLFGRTTMDAVRLPYARHREAGDAVPAGDGDRDRPRGAVGDHRRRRPRGRRADRRARRGLRHGCDARAGRGRQRVLLGRRGRASCPGAAHLLGRARHHRRLRGAVQVPAGSQRGSAAAARLPGDARNPRCLPALDRDPLRHAGAAVAGHVGGAGGGLRRARHRVRAQSPGGVARRRPQRCRT